MIFHSFDFLAFIAVLVAIYWRLPHCGQNALLLVASYFFYGYIHPWFLVLLTATALVDFFTSNRIAQYPQKKKFYLGVTLVANLGVLSAFKYLDFFTGGHALDFVHWLGFTQMTAGDVARLLPVGLSFYTFQSIAYVVDVYRGELPPQRKLWDFLLFVSFFPQLVAGPIQRAGFLAGQLATPRTFDARISRGAVVLMLWGYFKKLVIADNAALVANKVFSLAAPTWPVLWAGVFAFAVQILADFSAYTDIARGGARLLGFQLAPNFHHPYLSASPPEFWRRWHISLSTWFRDYVYIPLGGGRGTAGLVIRNIMITFLLSGLWHGASWNFLLWGGYHGLLLVLWRSWDLAPERWRPSRWPHWTQVLLTFILVNIGWLMFRETNLTMLLQHLSLNPLAASRVDWQMGLYLFCLVLTYAWPLWLHAWMDGWLHRRHPGAVADAFPGGKWCLLQGLLAMGLLLAIILIGCATSADFIYFQF
jgi:alginate O-acetyltransferase complex protein AlgI